jgi:ribosomal protein S18 acetylase RimI-like enzyme
MSQDAGTSTIVALTPDRAGDFLAFFDGPAFADNPEWGSCYCMFPNFTGTNDEWEQATAASNRAAKCALIVAGRTRGLLAYDSSGAVEGWCHAAPRTWLPKFDAFAPIDDGDHVGDIVCFVIGASARRQGLAVRLLNAACEQFARDGLAFAEAFPAKPKHDDPAAHLWRGPLKMYLANGFTIERELDNHFIVRRALP